MKLSKRKPNRLPDYDYSAEGYYFTTICTSQKQKILCNIVMEGLCALPKTILTDIGKDVEKALLYINDNYAAEIKKYVIMPNHIHFIIKMTGGHRGPPLQSVVGRMKSYTTQKTNSPLLLI